MTKKEYNKKVNICGRWVKYVRNGHYDRNHPKMSQDDLVARLQSRGLMMNRSSLSRIETGSRIVTDLEILCIADALEVPLTFLFNGTDRQLPKIEDLFSEVAEEFDDSEL